MRQNPTPDLFKKTLSRFASGVCVISTFDEKTHPVAMTINAFTSVSLDPPLVLFCIKKHATRAKYFCDNRLFSISILAHDQAHLSRHFATIVPGVWDEIGCTPLKGHPPFLKDASAHIACEKERAFDGGDHDIYLARVLALSHDAQKEPLVYFEKTYHATTPLSTYEKAS